MKNLVLVLLVVACVMPVSAQNNVSLEFDMKWSSQTSSLHQVIKGNMGDYKVEYHFSPSDKEGEHRVTLFLEKDNVRFLVGATCEMAYIKLAGNVYRAKEFWSVPKFSAYSTANGHISIKKPNKAQQMPIANAFGLFMKYGKKLDSMQDLIRELARIDLSELDKFSELTDKNQFTYYEGGSRSRQPFDAFKACGSFQGWRYVMAFDGKHYILEITLDTGKKITAGSSKGTEYCGVYGGETDSVQVKIRSDWINYDYTQSVNPEDFSDSTEEAIKRLFGEMIDRVACCSNKLGAAENIQKALIKLKAQLTAKN